MPEGAGPSVIEDSSRYLTGCQAAAVLCQMSMHYSPIVALDGHPKHLDLLLCQCVFANEGFWDISCSREASGGISRQGSVHGADNSAVVMGAALQLVPNRFQTFWHLASSCSTRAGSLQNAVLGARRVQLPACHS